MEVKNFKYNIKLKRKKQQGILDRSYMVSSETALYKVSVVREPRGATQVNLVQ